MILVAQVRRPPALMPLVMRGLSWIFGGRSEREVEAEVIERQQNIASVLKERSPRLAGTYRTALNALGDVADEDCESARVLIICHCMRELMLGLPAVVMDEAIPRPNPSSGALTRKLPELLRKNPEVDLGADQDMIPVPKNVAHAIGSIVTTAAQEDGRNRLIFAALVTGGKDGKHPAVKQWMDAYQFFLRWAHLDRNHTVDRPLPADSEMLANIRVVEDVIEVRTAAFFQNLKSLEGLLAEINAPAEEDA